MQKLKKVTVMIGAVGLMALNPCLRADGGAVIDAGGIPAAEVFRFRQDMMLFTNRRYRVAECPPALEGKRFLMASIDGVRFTVAEGGRLTVLTPIAIAGAASQAENLEANGFVRAGDEFFQLFGNNAIDQVWTYEKEVAAGESYDFGKWVVVLGFQEARGVVDRSRQAEQKPYRVHPGDLPNTGILFVDQAKDGRSGHGGITLTECANGDILAFYSVTWAEDWRGHGVGGWSQYRRSTDGGETWGEPVVFDYSKEVWDSRRVHSALVFSAVTAPDGTLVATLMRYANSWWEKQEAPVYFLSRDHGHSWEGPRLFDENATVEDISMTLSTHFVHDGEIFLVFRGGRSNMSPGGPHTLWVSGDNGETFQRRSLLPFADPDYYWAAGALDDGAIIVYTYNAHHRRDDEMAEKNIPYTISRDGGRTWSEVQTTHFAKGIRNMQMSGKLGEYYFMQGRSGSYQRERTGDDPGPGSFVLYASEDGIHWDEGLVLMSRLQTPGGGDCYSDSEIVGKHDPERPERLLVHADVSYRGARTNMHHWWVVPKNVDFTPPTGASRTPQDRADAPEQDAGGQDLGATLAE